MTRAVTPDLVAPDLALEAALKESLDEVERELEKAVRSDSEFVSHASGYLLSAGGKRFRPMLLLLSGHFGDPTDPRLTKGAVSIELVHVATLYHDDVIDEAESRRGIPSVNARWDNTVAILTGDFLFAKSSEYGAELGTEVSTLLARTIATLCDGQIREVEMAGRLDHPVPAYTEVIRRKTAALIATSCRLGGILSEAPPEAVEALDSFGEALGMGFQLSDDIMDVTATEETLGKEPGVDMKEGVYTLPVLLALAGPRGDELRELLAPGPPDGERLTAALGIVRASGAVPEARAAVGREVGRARDLAMGLAPGPARDALVHLAEFIARRCGAEVPRRP